MAIAFVRTTGKFEVAAATTVSGSFAALPTSGDLIVVIACVSTDGTVTSVSDNQGNTYTLVESPVVGSVHTVIARTITGATVGTFTLTVSTNGTAAGTFLTAVGLDYSGAASPVVTDGSATNSGTAIGSLTVGPITTVASGDLIVAGISSNLGVAVTWTDNQAAPWTQQLIESNGVSFEMGVGDDQVQATAGAISASWSISVATGTLSAALLAIQAAGVAGSVVSPRSLALLGVGA